MPVPRDIAVRFLVTRDDISKAMKDQQEAAKRTKQQVDAIAGGFDSLTNAQRRGLRDWIQLTNGPREMAKAQQRMLEIQLRYNAAVAQARTLTDRAARNAAIVAAVNARNMQQELSARVLAEQRILDMERRRRSGFGGGGTGGWDASIAGMKKFASESRGLIGTLNDLSFKMFVITFASKQMVDTLLNTFVQVGEKVEMARFKLETFTNSTKTFGQAFNVAQELGVGLDTVTGVLQRFAIANQSVGMTNKELMGLTRNIVALGKIGGASQQELNAGLIQLGQAFASGRFQGDEFRSVMENIPLVAMKLAEAIGTDIAGLRRMSTAGELTRDKIALLKDEIPGLQKILENLPLTTEVALQRISNAWDVLINQVLRAEGIENTAMAFDRLATTMTEWSAQVEQNVVGTQAWLAALKDAAIAVAILVAVMATFRRGAAVIAAVATAWKAWQTAATASAGTMALLVTRARLLVGLLSPLAAVITVAAVAIHAFNQRQQEAVDQSKELIGQLDDLETKYASMDRRELLSWGRKTSVAQEVTDRELQRVAQESEQVAARIAANEAKLNAAWAGEGFKKRLQERIEADKTLAADLAIQQEANIQNLKDLTRASEKQQQAQNELNKTTRQMAQAYATVSAELKKVFESLPALTRDLAVAEQGYANALKYEPAEARARTDRFRLDQEYATNVQRAVADQYDSNTTQQTIKAIQEQYDKKVKLLDLDTKTRAVEAGWNKERKNGAESSLQVIKAITAGSKASETDIQTYTQRLEQYKEYFEQASKTYGVPIALLRSMAFQESGFNMGAVSRTGARGVMQFMPKTAGMVGRQMGVDPQAILTDAQTNILAGAKYIADLAKQLGSWEAALGWYNGGKRGAGPNPAAETVGYKRNILASWQRQGGVEGDPEQAARAERDLYQKNADSFADSRMRMLETQRGYTAQVMVELERYRQANLQVDRDVELSDAAKNMAREANLKQFNARTASLMQERQVQEQEYRAETQALLDSTLSDQQRKEAETAAQILEIRRQQAESDGVITQRMMDDRIAAIERVAKSEQLNEMATSIGQAFGEAFGSLAKGGETASETMQRLLEALRDTVVQLLIIKPIAEMVANAINSIGTGGSGGGAGSLIAQIGTAAIGSYVGGGGAAGAGYWGKSIGGPFGLARGGYINGLAHGVYTSPTLFPMAGPGFHAFAKGTGLLGEAGPEAVMPLRRGPDGRLGVSGNAPNVTINNYTDGQVKTSVGDDGKLTIDIIRNTLARDILHGGNTLSRAMDTARARRG